MVSILLILLFIGWISLPFLGASQTVYLGSDPTLFYDFELDFIKSEMMKRLSQVPYIDPALSKDDYPQEVLLLLREDADLEALAEAVINARFTPSIEDLRFSFAVLKPGAYDKLKDVEGLLLALPDVQIDFPGDIDDIGRSLDKSSIPSDLSYPELIDYLGNLKTTLQSEYREKLISTLSEVSLTGDVVTPPSEDMYYVTDLLGLNKQVNGKPLKSQYNGTGVTIAVVDTGVDFGTLGLFSWRNKVARDSMGRTASFDADNQVIAFTNILVEAYSNGTHTLINSSGSDPLLWLSILPRLYPNFFPISWIFTPVPYSALFSTTFPVDMDVTGILNPGDRAKFGLLFEFITGLNIFPVLLVDSNLDGTYDTLYVDVSSEYKRVFGYTPDWSFADEQALTETGLTVPTYDHNGDGIPDFQAGTLAWGIDVFCAVPSTSGEQCSILEPIDDEGEYAVFVYDWQGHGTSVASVAAGVNDFVGNYYPEILFGTLQPYGSGIAPNASIMGIPIFSLVDIFEAWFWAAGFDLIPGTEGFYPVPGFGWVYGIWQYTGNHKADIISNSWGFIGWEHASQGWFIYGPFIITLFADAISLPSYLDPSYPGTLLVISAGNEGPGAGTTGPPGYSGLAITVAASTSLPWLPSLGWGGGYNDTIVFFSSRGPNVMGYPVPELSAPGAFGFAPTAIWNVLLTGGDGAFLDIFSGTSMAAPVVSGSAAVVIQAYRDILGVTPTPDEVKRLLLMSAKDMGLPPNVQGVGRVDVYNAIQYLMSGVAPGNGVDVYSPLTSGNYMMREFVPFLFNWFLSSLTGNNIFDDPSLLPFSAPQVWKEYPVYGSFEQGMVINGYPALDFNNPLSTAVSYNVEVVRDVMVHSEITTGVISSVQGPWSTSRTFTLTHTPWPGDYDFLRIQLTMDWQNVFDPNLDGFDDVNLYLYAFDWVDTNSNGFPEGGELSWLAFSPLTGTTQEVLLPKSMLDNLNGQLLIVVREVYNVYGLNPTFTLTFEYWKREPHPWITPSSPVLNVGANSFATVLLDITVPVDAVPTVEQGYIVLNPQTPGAKKFLIPFSFIISMPVSASEGLVKEVPFRPYSEGFYNPNFIRGLFDFGTRDAGDHRLWFMTYEGDPDERTFGIYAYSEWESPFTDIDMFSIDAGTIVNDKSENTWTGYNTLHQTRLTRTSEMVAVWPWPNAYLFGPDTISLWSRLYDGGDNAERVRSSVRFAKLNFGNGTQFDNTNFDARKVPGGIVINIPVFIETGVDLQNVIFLNPMADPGLNFTVTPNVTSAAAFSSDNKVIFRVFVSQNILDMVQNFGQQEFQFNVTVTADYLPYTTVFQFKILIKPFPLPLKTIASNGDSIVFLDVGTRTGEVIILPYYGYDPSTGQFGSTVGQMIKYPMIVKKVMVTSQWALVEVLIEFKYNDGTSAWLPGQIWIFRNSDKVYLTGAFQLLH